MTFVSYAQNFEDIILWRALKDIESGFYVDVGANDPTIDSVTRAFYDRGWSGINIEPSQTLIDQLCIERVRDLNLPIAVADQEGELTFYDVSTSGWSTLDASVAATHRNTGQVVLERQVKVKTLNQLFSNNVHRPIHFLKIDVEGAEGRVLKGLDLSVWRPWIILIESTIPNTNTPSHVDWEPYLLSSNYKFVYFDGLNRYYLALEHADMESSFSSPPNIFDDFILFDGHYFTVKHDVPQEIRAAEERARIAESRGNDIEAWAHEMEARAEASEKWGRDNEARAEASEKWARDNEARAAASEKWARDNEARAAASEKWGRDNEARAAASEKWGRDNEARAQAAEERLNDVEAWAREIEAWAQAAENFARENEARAMAAEARSEAFEARVITAEARAAAYEARVINIEAQLQAILYSTSWRITAPIRLTKYITKKICRKLYYGSRSISAGLFSMRTADVSEQSPPPPETIQHKAEPENAAAADVDMAASADPISSGQIPAEASESALSDVETIYQKIHKSSFATRKNNQIDASFESDDL